MKQHGLKGRKQSPEHVARKARKCEPGCECKRHGVNKDPASRERQSRLSRERWESGGYEGRAEKFSATWAAKTPEEKAEFSRKQSEARKAEWQKAKDTGRRRNIHFGTNKRVSRHELSLVPYMEALGYRHNTGMRVGRRVPDFVNEVGRQVFEYFGTYWHPRGRVDEDTTIAYYAERGWSCQVLWETNLFAWLQAHQHLVTDEQHEAAWKAAHVNNGYLKPSNV